MVAWKKSSPPPLGFHEPSFFQLYREYIASNNNKILVETDWIINEEEAKTEVGGLFLNRCLIRPKYFDTTNVPMIVHFFQTNLTLDSKYEIIDRNSEGYVALYSHSSYFFDHMREHVGHTIMRPIYYWAYNDTSRRVRNYYIIEKSSLNALIKGLREFWNEPIRRKHRNVLGLIRELDF